MSKIKTPEEWLSKNHPLWQYYNEKAHTLDDMAEYARYVRDITIEECANTVAPLLDGVWSNVSNKTRDSILSLKSSKNLEI